MPEDSLKSAGQKKGGGKGGRLMGLPTYVWVGVIAAGLLLGLYLRSKGGGGGSNTSASPTVDNSSVPATFDSGPIVGLSGQSAGGDTTASVDNGMSDLLNSLAVQSADTEALTAQLASLVSFPVAQVGSSGGSGAGTGKPKQKPHHKPHPAHKKHHKKEQKKNRKVPA